jgi:hypothetical protein
MKRFFAVVALLTMSAMPLTGFAKGNLARIEVAGTSLAEPLTVTDGDVLKQFSIWSGPNSGHPIGSPQSADSRSFVDWHKGIVDDVPDGMDSYEVSFFCVFARQSPDARQVYWVRYAFDPATKRGYVYLPGPGERNYRLNVSTIIHGVEGHWFNASTRWESLVAPLIREHGVRRAGEVAARH